MKGQINTDVVDYSKTTLKINDTWSFSTSLCQFRSRTFYNLTNN